MLINAHPRPLPVRVPYRIPPPRHHQRTGLGEMSSSEFNSLSGNGSGGQTTASGVADCSDWDTSSLGGLFQEGYSSSHHPLLPTTAVAPFGGGYTAFPANNNGPNGAQREFETQPMHQQQQQFSMHMLSYTSKFIPRPPPPPQPPSSLPPTEEEGWRVQQAQVNEYWASLAASTAAATVNQNNGWKMDCNNSGNNNISVDFGRGYEDFHHSLLPLQRGGGMGSFSLYEEGRSLSLAEDGHSPDILFSPNNDDMHDFPIKRTWSVDNGNTNSSNSLKHDQGILSHHGLPYTFYDDTTTAAAAGSLTDFTPCSSAQWTTTGIETVSPKALTLSSSSMSFSGESTGSECESVDSTSTTEGFGIGASVQSGGCNEKLQIERAEMEITKEPEPVRRKLPERLQRQYIAIAPHSSERSREVVVARTGGSRVNKVRPLRPFACRLDLQQLQSQTSSSTATISAPRNPPTPSTRNAQPQLAMTRTTKDAFLISSKQAGMSYRAIRTAGNFSEAESTLRGRYRTLTKQKEERVRKPEWTRGDVELLREAVEMFRCGKGGGKEGRRRRKTPWKRVAEYIEGNGGSYRFGNATCRKMWDRLGEEEGEEEEEE
ncbi:hypothetical protein O988_06671 [Pseudogymnoascus sp. VKM F-3808]|nr:hypothetical protein O988_06671 [Pseudogymnoascus sp. VKM F-3808]